MTIHSESQWTTETTRPHRGIFGKLNCSCSGDVINTQYLHGTFSHDCVILVMDVGYYKTKSKNVTGKLLLSVSSSF